MNRKDFIDEVMHYIVDNRNRPLIVEELNNHIDDRVRYYTDAGYSDREAEQMAIEKMGEPSMIATDMDKLYSTRSNIAIQSAVLVMYVLYMIASRLFLLGMYDSLSSVSVFLELRLFITTFVVLAIAQKRRLPLLSVFAMVHILLFYVFVAFDSYTSYIVYFFNCLFTGTLDKYKFFMSSYLVSQGSDAVVLESKILFALLGAVALVNFIVICLNKKPIDTRKINKLGSAMIGICLFLSVVGVAGAGVIFLGDGSSYCTYDNIYVYESDEKVDDVSKMEFFRYIVDYDWVPNPYITSFELEYEPEPTVEYVKYDNFVSYKKCTTTYTYHTKKKYVMVVMEPNKEFDGDIPAKSTGWVEADGYTFKDSVHYIPPSFDDLVIEFV